MTKLFESGVDTVRSLPPEAQEHLHELFCNWCGNELPPIAMTVEDETSFEESMAEAERGEFVSDETILAFWAKHGL